MTISPTSQGARPMPALNYAPFNFLAPPGPKAIIKLTSLKHGVAEREMFGPTRVKGVVAARHEAMTLIYGHCGISSIRVGRRFHRDHTTVLYAVRKTREGRRPYANH